jgi:hypothetical protein
MNGDGRSSVEDALAADEALRAVHGDGADHVSVHCRAFVEYKGVIPPDQIQDKQNALEREANKLISEGTKVLKEVVLKYYILPTLIPLLIYP